MPNYTFLAQNVKLNIHLTKSPKREHISKLCFYILGEHNCLVLTYQCVPKLKYSVHARIITSPTLHTITQA